MCGRMMIELEMMCGYKLEMKMCRSRLEEKCELGNGGCVGKRCWIYNWCAGLNLEFEIICEWHLKRCRKGDDITKNDDVSVETWGDVYIES